MKVNTNYFSESEILKSIEKSFWKSKEDLHCIVTGVHSSGKTSLFSKLSGGNINTVRFPNRVLWENDNENYKVLLEKFTFIDRYPKIDSLILEGKFSEDLILKELKEIPTSVVWYLKFDRYCYDFSKIGVSNENKYFDLKEILIKNNYRVITNLNRDIEFFNFKENLLKEISYNINSIPKSEIYLSYHNEKVKPKITSSHTSLKLINTNDIYDPEVFKYPANVYSEILTWYYISNNSKKIKESGVNYLGLLQYRRAFSLDPSDDRRELDPSTSPEDFDFNLNNYEDSQIYRILDYGRLDAIVSHPYYSSKISNRTRLIRQFGLKYTEVFESAFYKVYPYFREIFDKFMNSTLTTYVPIILGKTDVVLSFINFMLPIFDTMDLDNLKYEFEYMPEIRIFSVVAEPLKGLWYEIFKDSYNIGYKVILKKEVSTETYRKIYFSDIINNNQNYQDYLKDKPEWRK